MNRNDENKVVHVVEINRFSSSEDKSYVSIFTYISIHCLISNRKSRFRASVEHCCGMLDFVEKRRCFTSC